MSLRTRRDWVKMSFRHDRLKMSSRTKTKPSKNTVETKMRQSKSEFKTKTKRGKTGSRPLQNSLMTNLKTKTGLKYDITNIKTCYLWHRFAEGAPGSLFPPSQPADGCWRGWPNGRTGPEWKLLMHCTAWKLNRHKWKNSHLTNSDLVTEHVTYANNRPPLFRLCTTIRQMTTILKTRVSGSRGQELSACCSSSSSLGEWGTPLGDGGGR